MMIKGSLSVVLALFLAGTASAEIPERPYPELRITEIMASNGLSLEDAFGRSPDWIEIHNSGEEPISLAGIAVSDSKKELERYVFGEDAVIQPGEYIIVFASGAKKDIADEHHTSYKLSAAGEAVYLSKDGVLIDAVLFGPQEKDISWALDSGGTFVKSLTPTPGAANLITPIKDEGD